MTQKTQVTDALKRKVIATIKEIEILTNLPNPTIRRILGQGAKNGELTRLSKGVYTLKTKDGKTASIIKCADALKEVKNLVNESAQFDMIFLDVPYIIKGARGGNRNLTKYKLITAQEFEDFMLDIVQLTRNNKTPIFFMFSASKSNKKELQQYYNALIKSGLKPCGFPSQFRKLYKNGKPFAFCGIPLIEWIFTFSLSGEVNFTLEKEYRFKKDSSYQTAKPTELLEAIINASTSEYDTILDMFAGSGSTAKASVKTNRNILSYEIDEQQAEKIQQEIKRLIDSKKQAFADLRSLFSGQLELAF
jgi:DNA modification methylase